MRLALLATLFLPLLLTPAAAQSAEFAYAAPHAVRGATLPPVAGAPVVLPAASGRALAARVSSGITAAWPTSPDGFADYAAHEIEAGTVSGDLYVRWYAFDLHAETFVVEVSRDGAPFERLASVAAVAGEEQGLHAEGLAPGLYEVRVREWGSTETEIVSTSVRVRI